LRVKIDKGLYSDTFGTGLPGTGYASDLAGDEAQQCLGQLPAVQGVVETGLIDLGVFQIFKQT
jgi:hypothetical protein